MATFVEINHFFNIEYLIGFRCFLGGGILFLFLLLRLCGLGLVFLLGIVRSGGVVGFGLFFGIWSSSWCRLLGLGWRICRCILRSLRILVVLRLLHYLAIRG